MYEISATFKGLVPMMMDRFHNPEELEAGAKKKSKKANPKDVELKLHRDKKGVYVPADNIRMMLIGNQMRPGAAKILGSYIEKSKGTEYVQMCKSSIWILGPADPLKVYINPSRLTYDEVDERSFPTKTGQSVARKITRRPLLTLPWSLSFIIQVTDDQIHESKVRDLFDVAGLRCGVCAYGPTFGRCVIVEWKVLPEDADIPAVIKEVPKQVRKNHKKAKSHGKKKKKKTS
jgi:hypothetical protein